MIQFRQKGNDMIKKITDKLDQDHIEDYEVSEVISKSDVTFGTNLKELKVYIPEELDYFQYQLDNWVRRNIPGCYTRLDLERDVYVVTFRKDITFDKYIKMIKFAIEQEGFCVIYDK